MYHNLFHFFQFHDFQPLTRKKVKEFGGRERRGWSRSTEDEMGESGCLRVQPKEGGILHLRLNKNERPIEHK